jgi:DNA-binding MltR family transcriptional regulator
MNEDSTFATVHLMTRDVNSLLYRVIRKRDKGVKGTVEMKKGTTE